MTGWAVGLHGRYWCRIQADGFPAQWGIRGASALTKGWLSAFRAYCDYVHFSAIWPLSCPDSLSYEHGLISRPADEETGLFNRCKGDDQPLASVVLHVRVRRATGISFFAGHFGVAFLDFQISVGAASSPTMSRTVTAGAGETTWSAT